jgi:hypothetical protein
MPILMALLVPAATLDETKSLFHLSVPRKNCCLPYIKLRAGTEHGLPTHELGTVSDLFTIFYRYQSSVNVAAVMDSR